MGLLSIVSYRILSNVRPFSLSLKGTNNGKRVEKGFGVQLIVMAYVLNISDFSVKFTHA